MLLANYHTHTARCRHAWGEDKEYVENAIQEGMKVLGFSDHCPWIFPKDYVSHTRMEPQELDGYFYALEALRQEYARDITIYIGFESEYIPELMEEQNQLLDGYPVDYMILGEHFTASEVTGPYTGFPTESEQDLEKYVDLCIAGMAQRIGNSAIIGCDAHTPDRLSNPEYIQTCLDLAQRFGLPVVDFLPGLMPKA